MIRRKVWTCLLAAVMVVAVPCLGNAEDERDLDSNTGTTAERSVDPSLPTVSTAICANTCWNYWYKKCSGAGIGHNTCSEYAGWQTSNGNCANYHADTAECTAGAAV